MLYDDVIVVQEQGRTLQFPAYRILDRSGLKHSDPREPGSRRYRFEPFWCHRLLVERFNDRIAQRLTHGPNQWP